MNKAKKVMDLFEYESKYADMAKKIIAKGFKQIDRELNDLYKKSTDQNNWFYVGNDLISTLSDGVKLISDNFNNKSLPRNIANELNK